MLALPVTKYNASFGSRYRQARKGSFLSFFRLVGYGFAGYLIIASSSFFFFLFSSFLLILCVPSSAQCQLLLLSFFFLIFFFSISSTVGGLFFFFFFFNRSVNRQLFPDILFVRWLNVALRPQ